MLLLPPPDLLKDFHHIVSSFPEQTRTSVRGQLLQARINVYMERQAFRQYYPEIHWRVDMENFMAKQQDNWNLIEYRLEDAEIEAFEAWQAREKVSTVSALNYCAEKGIKVSFTFSEKNSNWCVSLTGTKDNRFNSGSTLTNWSDEPIEAFMMGIYKASIVFNDGVWKTRKSSMRG